MCYQVDYNKTLSLEEPDNEMDCPLQCIGITVSDHLDFAREAKAIITDDRWITKLDPYDAYAYQDVAEQTTKRLVEMFNGVQNTLTGDFGEFIVSLSSQLSLENENNHIRPPLAELWKQKELGNPGYDFHTECPEQLINFGEAKFVSNGQAHNSAARQVLEIFIPKNKHRRDKKELEDFLSQESIERLVKYEEYGICLSFSINNGDFEKSFLTALNNEYVKGVSKYCKKLYLIGVIS